MKNQQQAAGEPKKRHPQDNFGWKRFVLPMGNKAAEKWTEETVTPYLVSMLEYLMEDERFKADPNKTPEQNEAARFRTNNPVRANTIKLKKEICLIVGVTYDTFHDWVQKFTRERIPVDNGEPGETMANPNYSVRVSQMVKAMNDILECRLIYSGTKMDEFILKNHYGMKDKLDVTTGEERLPAMQGTKVIIGYDAADPEDDE